MIYCVDFFCGSGGLTRGLLNSGIKVVLGIDSDESCRDTYEKNNNPAKFLHKDIRKLKPADIKCFIKDIPKENLLFVACAPCQPFSKQVTKTKLPEQKTLLGEFARFVKAYEPGQVFVENVPGIAKVKGFSTYRRFCKLLSDLRYSYSAGNVDAKKYGVPQNRYRHILVASKTSLVKLPQYTHGSSLAPYVTVREAIGGYSSIRAGETHPEIPNHTASLLSEKNLERMKHTPHDGGRRLDWPENLWLTCHKDGYNGHSDVYGRMFWDKPAPALTCRCNSLSNGRYGHPKQDRAISLREAAALQTFEDFYVFYGCSRVKIAKQIGNAVPVKLAENVGKLFVNLDE